MDATLIYQLALEDLASDNDIDNVQCLVARPGEGTYECDIQKPCNACKIRNRITELQKTVNKLDKELSEWQDWALSRCNLDENEDIDDSRLRNKLDQELMSSLSTLGHIKVLDVFMNWFFNQPDSLNYSPKEWAFKMAKSIPLIVSLERMANFAERMESKMKNGQYVETYPDGSKYEKWYLNDQFHREDGPAYVVVRPDGYRFEKWYLNGELHRLDGPAHVYIQPNGYKYEYWCQNDQLHRKDGPAYIYTQPDGFKIEEWQLNGQCHREDGPAYVCIIPNGTKVESWHKDDLFHREDGPAYIYTLPDGSKIENWFKNGVSIDPPKSS